MAGTYVGTSGWSYRDWVGTLYPTGTPASRFLETYAERLPTVEAHNTFRRRPNPPTLASWVAKVPAHFRFAPKAHVGITHRADIEGVEDRVVAFFDGLAPLGAHIGPVLFQLPHHRPDLDRLGRILSALPPDPPAAFELHPDWHVPEVLDGLDRAGATVVVTDHDGAAEPALADVGPLSYVRLRRPSYDAAALDRWAERLMASGRPAFVYLRHDGDPAEAVRLWDAVRG